MLWDIFLLRLIGYILQVSNVIRKESMFCMSLIHSSFNCEDNVLFKLEKLYERYGYVKLKTSKFEKYDFYVNNKYFFSSSGMITFTDINGDLLALKPDNTFSIAKSLRVGLYEAKKIYYYDDVYRICSKTKLYEKIMQYGVECIGYLDLYNLCEIVGLAADSLNNISNESVLNISHLGVVLSLLRNFNIEEMKRIQLLKFIEDKNVRGIETMCNIMEIPDDVIVEILSLISAYGPVDMVIPKLKNKIKNARALEYLDELDYIVKAVQNKTKVKIIIDMSITTGYMNYYDGIIFKGFIKDVSSSVVVGGQYNKLMKYFDRNISAVGFGIYLDFIRRNHKVKHDIDIFVLYNDNDDVKKVYQKVRSLIDEGNSVLAGKTVDKSLKIKRVINFSEN